MGLGFAGHFGKSPEKLGPEQIRSYQIHLRDKGLAPSSIIVAVAALRFLYKISLGKRWIFDEIIPAPKQHDILPEILSREEVLHFLSGVPRLNHRAILTACYGTGLGISEAISLKISDIDKSRMIIRVQEGNGAKDRLWAAAHKRSLAPFGRPTWENNAPQTPDSDPCADLQW